MSIAEFTTSSYRSSNTTINNSEITKTDKIILAVLLLILGLLLTIIGQKILQIRPGGSISHNTIIVGRGDRPFYAFNVDQFRKTNNVIPKNLGGEAEWSPDGQWIVFSMEEPTHETVISQIYIMQADGSQRTHIPLPQGSSWGDWGKEPTWSPDGKQIAFAAPMGIMIANVGCVFEGESCTPQSHLLSRSAAGYWPSGPDWSPDARQIIYSAGWNTYLMKVDGQSPLVTLSAGLQQPSWSPDGSKIVGICNHNICIVNKDGSNLTYLTQNTTQSLIQHPKWSPDGQQIAYISSFSDEPIPGFCGPDSGCPLPTSVFIMNADGSTIKHLPFDHNMVIDWFTWYP